MAESTLAFEVVKSPLKLRMQTCILSEGHKFITFQGLVYVGVSLSSVILEEELELLLVLITKLLVVVWRIQVSFVNRGVFLLLSLLCKMFEEASYEIIFIVPIDLILLGSALSAFIPAIPLKVIPDVEEVVDLFSVRT